jgi:hypothetical protein
MQLLAVLFAWSYLAQTADSFYGRIFSQSLKYGPDIVKERGSFLSISKRPQFGTDNGELNSKSIERVIVQLKKTMDDKDSDEFIKIMKTVSLTKIINI